MEWSCRATLEFLQATGSREDLGRFFARPDDYHRNVLRAMWLRLAQADAPTPRLRLYAQAVLERFADATDLRSLSQGFTHAAQLTREIGRVLAGQCPAFARRGDRSSNRARWTLCEAYRVLRDQRAPEAGAWGMLLSLRRLTRLGAEAAAADWRLASHLALAAAGTAVELLAHLNDAARDPRRRASAVRGGVFFLSQIPRRKRGASHVQPFPDGPGGAV